MNKLPDYQRWLRKSVWQLDEAVLIVLGIDPANLDRLRIPTEKGLVGQRLRMRSRNPPNVFWDFLGTAMKSEGHGLDVIEYSSESMLGTRYAKVLPSVFVKWSKYEGFAIPEELSPLLVSDEEERQQQPNKKKGMVKLTEPKRKDDWFNVIHDAINAFQVKNGYTPNQTALWQTLVKTPPVDYGIEYNARKKILTMPDGVLLDRENFNKRYKGYYPDSRQ